MKYAKRTVFGALFIILGACVFSSAAFAGPKVVFPEQHHDFGTLPDSGIYNYTFTVQNAGDAELVLERIITDCGCTTVEYDRSIAPGGAGKITVALNTGGYRGITVTRKIKVFTNDPENDAVYLKISATVEAVVEMSPQRLSFTGVLGEPLSGTVTIRPAEKYPMKILSAEARFGQNIRYEFKEDLTGTEPVYFVTVYNTKDTAGRYFDEIILKTDNAAAPELSVRVNGTILPSSY